jgi:hypothetical protein
MKDIPAPRARTDQGAQLPTESGRAIARHGRRFLMGLVVPDLVHPFFSEVAKYLAGVIRPSGYTLLISPSEEDGRRKSNTCGPAGWTCCWWPLLRKARQRCRRFWTQACGSRKMSQWPAAAMFATPSASACR